MRVGGLGLEHVACLQIITRTKLGQREGVCTALLRPSSSILSDGIDPRVSASTSPSLLHFWTTSPAAPHSRSPTSGGSIISISSSPARLSSSSSSPPHGCRVKRLTDNGRPRHCSRRQTLRSGSSLWTITEGRHGDAPDRSWGGHRSMSRFAPFFSCSYTNSSLLLGEAEAMTLPLDEASPPGAWLCTNSDTFITEPGSSATLKRDFIGLRQRFYFGLLFYKSHQNDRAQVQDEWFG